MSTTTPHLTHSMDDGANIYEKVDWAKIDALRATHAWLVDPLYRASDSVREMPFFQWTRRLKTPSDFKPAAVQLYYHSATFPKVMGLMLGNTPLSENAMMPFYAKHAFGEADHHQLLMDWMLKHKVLGSPQEIEDIITTPETNACVNLAYQLAVEQDRAKWLVAINCGIERCSNDFFKTIAPKMHELGVGHIYFDVHVEADEHHSIMGLEYIEPQSPDSARGRELIAKALEGVSLWAAMLHSWINIDLFPRFHLDGTLRDTKYPATH
ncbi:MAG: iron-containing redox enzyme family protein [Gammaproteobacteria bacterium]